MGRTILFLQAKELNILKHYQTERHLKSETNKINCNVAAHGIQFLRVSNTKEVQSLSLHCKNGKLFSLGAANHIYSVVLVAL